MKFVVTLMTLYMCLGCSSSRDTTPPPAKKPENSLDVKDINSQNVPEGQELPSPLDPSNETPNFQNIVNPQSLMPTANLQQIAANELPQKLNGIDEFFNKKNEFSYSCISQALGQSTKVIGGPNRLVMQGHYSGSNCNSELSAAMGSTVQFQVLSVIECDDTDFSTYNGRPYLEVQNLDEMQMCQGKDIRFTIQTSYSFQLQHRPAAAGQQSNQVVTATVIHNSATWQNSQLCTWKPQGGAYILQPGCQLISNTTYRNVAVNGQIDPTKMLDTYVNITPQNLVKSSSLSPFFAAGNMQFNVNHWRGQMIYNGPQTPPQWQAQAPNSQMPLSGVLGQAPIN